MALMEFMKPKPPGQSTFSKLAVPVGTALGAAVGSVVPGAGTLAGASLGAALGGAAGGVAKGIADKDIAQGAAAIPAAVGGIAGIAKPESLNPMERAIANSSPQFFQADSYQGTGPLYSPAALNRRRSLFGG